MSFKRVFSTFANGTAKATGSPWAFVICVVVVALWAVSGPVFKFSDTWQLVINTGTTIITFLMVFLIQNTQNRDGAAIQTKLDELILTSAAENRFVGIEKLTDDELDILHLRCLENAKAHAELHQQVQKEVESRKGKGKGEAKPPRRPRKTAAGAKPKAAASPRNPPRARRRTA
jgi:low affinity Fe/Cu permease